MRKSILLVLVVLLVFMPRCWLFDDCYFDEDCDDDNPCTKDICDWTYVGSIPYEFSWCTADYSYYCRHIDECKSGDADGGTGMCEAGECGPSREASKPVGDGGGVANDVGAPEVQP
ncbi:MAG: hypothetical protein JRG70_21015 [Deltaproteobacteria bacterium]|nr:hypothetical protein [Deltaproteobacteria bacterium]